MEYVMLDIETLGTKANSVILSISAIEFNKKGEYGEQFHVDIDPKSCVDIGLEVDINTVIWWMGQSDEARKQFTDDRKRVSIEGAISSFKQWYAMAKTRGVGKIFARDPDFDCNKIEDACNKLGLRGPFDRGEKIAIRTLDWLRPNFHENAKREGVQHNGIDDCKYQIQYVVQILNDISLDFHWEEPVRIGFGTIDKFSPNDVIATKEAIEKYNGNVPEEELVLVGEDNTLSKFKSSYVVVNDNPDQLWSRYFSIFAEERTGKPE